MHASTVKAWETLVTPPPDVLQAAADLAATAPDALALPAGGGYAVFMTSFRAADMRVGGGHLYQRVLDYLHTAVAPHLLSGHDDDGQSPFTAAAGLVDVAAWAAHDAGDDQAAARHFARSLDLARLGDDRQLTAHVLASSAHLANHCGDTEMAFRYARRGREVLADGPPVPELEARLIAMQARGHAAGRRADECVALLLEAERMLGDDPAEVRSPWVSHFDEASLACEAARCARELGDHAETRRQAELILDLRPAGTRSRAFGQLLLVTALIEQRRPDEACAQAHEVLASTSRLGSALVVRELAGLRRALVPHARDRAVAEFLGCLDSSLREREWLLSGTGTGE